MSEKINPFKKLETNSASNIKKIIAVISGKGGVGKSTVTSIIAKDLNKKGYKVGILDADLTGPSIPKMFNVNELAYIQDDMILPGVTKEGIRIISSNMVVENAEQPVVWRGPVLNNVLQQFYKDTKWDQLDYLIVDMPPGTGDVPLTVFQSFPIDGVIVVTTPQDLVSMIVMKACNMAKMVHIPILGVIENMSYFECPKCHERTNIFGASSLPYLEKEKELKALDALPILEETVKKADEGDMYNSSLTVPLAIKAIEELM